MDDLKTLNGFFFVHGVCTSEYRILSIAPEMARLSQEQSVAVDESVIVNVVRNSEL